MKAQTARTMTRFLFSDVHSSVNGNGSFFFSAILLRGARSASPMTSHKLLAYPGSALQLLMEHAI